MNHTKGEWKYTTDGVVIASDGKQIASVFPRDREANAQLISSAPDLYEACKKLTALTFWNAQFRGKHPTFYDNVVRALAKAEGKTETLPSPWGPTREEAEMEGRRKPEIE